jgi:alkanesulfonate monooxygenase SsuD/methylene tetrahydromethanopterin reductase-like flavin-dependent oxidoreductase (luciferase family)
MTREAVAERIAVVREAATAAGRLAEIELNIRAFFVSVIDDRAGTIAGIAKMLRLEESLVAESPFALIGSTAAIADELVRRREELGFSYVIVGGEDVESFAPVVAQLTGT